ncbi:glucosamine-6-phosphate deaminase [Entomospira nematocerorum]|uniref:Glucosamine-6-phosphate deaminase n=1 Tax=Entomospira nematocerorum TaxID=2719987 RepID=A0A968GAN6_9SPIO|nr:glucosamine-6-phosphate deaminase [Entomospira nematocera]NIZ46319.1 glucosamine-6-phosphate deaminase [Entomospira nematocera]WDI33877.1 glucosamine-6-phosphate deaminase [Entomospira nematocera]
MHVKIKSDAKAVGQWVGEYIAARINDYKPTADRPFVLGLATGSTPIPTYETLIQLNKAGKVSFEHVVTFNMDEYVGLPQSHPESYYSFMWKHLFDHINIKKENVHILNGNAPDLDKECRDYEDSIKKFGGMEIIIGGIGVDGHIAFNEPGSSLVSRTRCQPLLHETRLVNSRFFDNDINQVPTHAVTMGVATVTDSREVLLLVTGHNKAEALSRIVEGSVSHWWTASVLQLHENSTVICDEPACARLQVGTYKYFKEIDG